MSSRIPYKKILSATFFRQLHDRLPAYYIIEDYSFLDWKYGMSGKWFSLESAPEKIVKLMKENQYLISRLI